MTGALVQRKPTWYEVIIGDLFDLLKSQPQQVLLSTGSVTIVAAEAALMVPFPANIAVAIGAEWAYLRGIASSGKGDKGWVTALNWGALLLVVLYGMLWGGRKFGAIPQHPDLWWAWLLVAIHIIPLAFVSLAAAMVHRSAASVEEDERARWQAVENERQRRIQAQRDELAIETERERMKLEMWKEAQHTKAALQVQPVVPVIAPAQVYVCDHCGATLTQPQHAAMRRWGKCKSCPPKGAA